MPNVLTIDNNGVIIINEEKRVRLKVVLSGAYVQAVRGANTGEVLDLTAVLNPGFLPEAFWGSKGPTCGRVLQGPAGYAAEILPGADGQHWLLKLYSAVTTEVVAGAYDVAATGDLDFYIEFVGRNFD